MVKEVSLRVEDLQLQKTPNKRESFNIWNRVRIASEMASCQVSSLCIRVSGSLTQTAFRVDTALKRSRCEATKVYMIHP